MQLNKPIVMLDIETTGLSISNDRIIKINLKKIVDLDEPAESKTYLLNPGKEVSDRAYEIHGIDNESVKNEPHFVDIMDELYDYIAECVLVGYNIKEFDFPLLYEEFNREDFSFNIDFSDVIDLKQIYYHKEPRTLKGAHEQYVAYHGISDHNKDHVDLMYEVFLGQTKKYKDLPDTISDLGQYYDDPSRLDLAGKVVMVKDKPCITFGKYIGRTLQYIEENDPSYIIWILNSDTFTGNTKNIISKYTSVEG